MIVSGDDANAMDTVAGIDRRVLTFGLGEGCDITATNFTNHWSSFDILVQGTYYCHVDLPLVGRHNCTNALAAAAAAWVLDVSGEAVAAGLSGFAGVGRRMEYKGLCNGAAVYDNYDHHPSELHALLSSIREKAPGKRVVAAFQPHTYTRTQAFFDDFVRELQLADQVYLTEIYAAREKKHPKYQRQSPGRPHRRRAVLPHLDDLAAALKANVTADDVVLTIGAGSITQVCPKIVD